MEVSGSSTKRLTTRQIGPRGHVLFFEVDLPVEEVYIETNKHCTLNELGFALQVVSVYGYSKLNGTAAANVDRRRVL